MVKNSNTVSYMSLIPLNFLYKRRRRDTTEPVQSPNRPEGRKTTETTPRNLISTGQKVKGPETWNELRSSLGRRHVLRRCRGGIGVPPVLLAVVAVVALVGDDEHRRLAGSRSTCFRAGHPRTVLHL